jgi:hypothetical protein
VIEHKPAPDRLSIEERAGRRDRMAADGTDRYTALVETLRAGESMPKGREVRDRVAWNPIAKKLIFVAIGLAIVYFAVQAGANYLRNQRVDTWSGPDATVQSGEQLAGCPALNGLYHDVFPTWVRYNGRVYGLTEAKWAIVERYGQLSLTRSGYELNGVLLLLEDKTQAGQQRDFVVLMSYPGAAPGEAIRPMPAGPIYRHLRDCA